MLSYNSFAKKLEVLSRQEYNLLKIQIPSQVYIAIVNNFKTH